MSKVEANSIPAILDAIVGSTSANGDTYLDDESLQNIGKLEAVCGWVCDRIHRAYSGEYTKQCASAEQVAHAVRRASCFILDYMGIDRESLLELADELEWRYEAAASPGELGYVNAGEMAECASRIRDALGAEDA